MTGQKIRLCLVCDQRARWSSKDEMWYHIRPQTDWHRARVKTTNVKVGTKT